jgi:hypothetical protein
MANTVIGSRSAADNDTFIINLGTILVPAGLAILFKSMRRLSLTPGDADLPTSILKEAHAHVVG